jgi:DNA polymerase I-like protein with 3'-5' exonuclease and polymerase domains
MQALVLPPNLRIGTPEEVVPILLDKRRSPVVSLDTEFDSSVPTCRAPLHGLSMAGGTPEEGIVGCFWPYEKGYERQPWSYVRDQVLIPIFTDPDRIVVEHPPKVDMQVIHPRGVPESIIRAKIECTMSMLHAYDENLPKGLKDVGECLLGVRGLQSYAATQKEMGKLRKEGERLVKQYLKGCWETYRDYRKKPDSPLPVGEWASWQRLVLGLPHKMNKADVEASVLPQLRRVIMDGDYEKRIRAVFEHYAALDALLTLQLRYFLMREIEADLVPFHRPGARDRVLSALAVETPICHPIVTEMEENGLKIDIPMLSAIKVAMDVAMGNLREEVVRLWGFAPDVEVTTSLVPGATGEKNDEDDEFNPGSTDQIAHIVWNVWQLRPPPWTQQHGGLSPKWIRAKDGMCKVDKNVLGWLADNPQRGKEQYAGHIAKLLEWKSFATLMSNFVNPLLSLALADPLNRVHPSFWPVGARTGRFSSSDPNAENIPRPHTMPCIPIPPGADPTKPPLGVNAEIEKDKATGQIKSVAWRVSSLRNVFIAEKDWCLVSADLAQVENRLVAHESNDPAMYDLFTIWDCADCKTSGRTTEPLHTCPNCGAKDGKRDKSKPDQPAVKGFCLGRDIHAASSVALGLDIKYGASEGRQRAKAFNHAASYGMGARTLARREGMKLKDAEEGLEAWHRRYTQVRPLQERIRNEIQTLGFVTMWDGDHTRRFYAQRLLMISNNFLSWEWEGVIREGVNVLAQGGTGIGMKRAMIAIRKRLREHENPLVRMTRLVNQIHDEVLYECPAAVARIVLDIVCWELEHAFNLRVPIIAEGGFGPNWGRAHA